MYVVADVVLGESKKFADCKIKALAPAVSPTYADAVPLLLDPAASPIAIAVESRINLLNDAVTAPTLVA